MISARLRTVIHTILVLLLVGEATVGYVLPSEVPEQIERVADALERTWEGGGAHLMFVDDMRPGTEAHFEGLDSIVTDQYYGGAVPEIRDGPARWGQESYRWGMHAMEGPSPGWTHDDSAWRFGGEEDGQDGYLGGSYSELVTPVVDLRSVPRPPDTQVHAVGPDSICSGCLDPVSLVNGVYQTILPGGEQDVVSPVQVATAALRLRHAYDFQVAADGSLRDGARVEVSTLQQAGGSWTPWQGVDPVDRALLIGEDRLRGRTTVSGIPVDGSVVVDPSLPAPGAGVDVHVADLATISVGPDGSPGLIPGPQPKPHLYQGMIASSAARAGPWNGFGADSMGMVESVFDMSPFAGSLVRLRFVVSTSEALDPPLTLGERGWMVDQMEVHAVSADPVAVVGLAVPGSGTVLAPGVDVEPSIVLHNTGRDEVDVAIATTLGETSHVRSVRLGVGPDARVVVPTGHTLEDIEVGLYTVDVVASVQKVLRTPLAEASLATHSTQAGFHFAVAQWGDWSQRGLTFFPLVEDADGDLQEDPTGKRSLARGQPARIHVLLDNLGPTPQTVRLGATDDPEAWDLRPALVDELGNEFGTITPVTAPAVDIPPSRELSGTFGAPGTTEVVWEWSGTDNARALQLVLIRDSQDPHEVLHGGTVVVQSTVAAAFVADFRNPWMLDAGAESCVRVAELHGALGVAHCPEAPAGIVSAAKRVQGIDLLRGNQTSVQMTYHGGPVGITLQTLDVAVPGELPPVSGVWSDAVTVQLPASPGVWNKASQDLASLDEGFSGFVRLRIDAAAPVDIDEVRLAMRVQNEQESLLAPLTTQTWDVTFTAGSRTVEASSASGLMHLHGIDSITSAVNAEQSIIGVGDITIDQGDVEFVQDLVFGGTGRDEYHIAAGRPREDSFLVLPGPIDLTGLARPEIRFRHWHELGHHGTVYVEAATLPLPVPPENPTSAIEDVLPESLTGWSILAEYTSDSPDLTTREARVSLEDFIGQSVHLRFRYHIDATVLLRTSQPMEAGWIVEDIEVAGWSSGGPVVRHVATAGYPGYQAVGGLFGGSGVQLPSEANCWVREAKEWAIHTCNTFRGVSTLVMSPIDIGAMQTPTLTIRSQGELSGELCSSGAIWFPVVDVEYQVRNNDGAWPVQWMRANPIRQVPEVGGGFYYEPVLVDDDDPVTPLVNPETGVPNGVPFSVHEGVRDNCGALGTSRAGDSVVYEDAVHRFSLDPLGSLGATSNPVRLRLDAWVGKFPLADGRPTPDLGSLQVHAVEVGEYRHAVDASLSAIEVLADDASSLAARAPEVLQQFVLPGEKVTGSDLVPIAVNVTNEGFVPVDVSVSLQGVRSEGSALDVTWIRQQGGAQIPTGLRTGLLTDLPPGAEGQVLFRADMLDAPPGTYTFSARVDVTNGVDTNPSNDLMDQGVRLLPFRDLVIDASASSVEPFVAGSDRSRSIRVTVTNEGNVDETDLSVDAEVVRMVGLTAFVPLDPPLPIDTLMPWQGGLARRGDDRQTIRWDLDPTGLDPGFDVEQAFRPGEKYAVKITVAAGEGSVKTWWPPKGLPLSVTEDGTGLLDITRMPTEECQCALLPFLVEREIYRTDFSPQNSTSVLPDAYPVDTLPGILGGWSVDTMVGGESVTPAERPDLPTWRLAPASGMEQGFEGKATGNVWHLPAYDGLEVIENQLVSAPLPAHVVRDDSRAILSMHHATAGMEDGQVTVEVRQNTRGEWGPWTPVGALRSERVAVVVPPDFPRVIAGGLSSAAEAYVPESLRPDHPVPPFYDNALGLDYIQAEGYYGPEDLAPTCGVASPLCQWTPPPDFDGPERIEWKQALDETLRLLSARFGSGNVGLFTTPSPDLGIGGLQDGRLVYEVSDGPLTHGFPIEGLDALGLRLDTYGAILLMGDNATSTFADRSQALVRMSHGPDDWAYKTPTQTALTHHAELFSVLRAAPGAGVRVLGAIGPAAATLSLSETVGPVATVPMAVWQTARHMPVTFLQGINVHCTGSETGPETQEYFVPGPQSQPFSPCVKVSGNDCCSTDFADPHNYYRISPQDAQSLAMRDFVDTVSTRDVNRSDGINRFGNCQPSLHPFIGGPANRCDIFAAHQTVQIGDVAVVTASMSNDVPTWIDNVVGSLMSLDGALPPTEGVWTELPARMAFPVGGSFWRDAEGRERFDGKPTQVRVTVRSEPDFGGHGAMAVDGIALLGTTRTQGLGIEVVTPQDGSSHAPGRSFTPVVQVTNRGLIATGETMGVLEVGQQILPSTACTALPVTDIEFDVDFLDPGQQVTIPLHPPSSSLFNGGTFPYDPDCSVPASQQEYVFDFKASLLPQDPALDDDPLDDADVVVAIGRELVQITVDDIGMRPAQVFVEEAGVVEVQATVSSVSTQPQPVTMDVALYPARPLVCDRGTGGNTALYGCDPSDALAAPIPLAASSITRIVQRGGTTVLSIPIDVDAQGLTAGVYRARAQVYTFDGSQQVQGLTTHDMWLHLGADEDVSTAKAALAPDGGWAAEFTTLDEVAATGLPTSPQVPGVWDPAGFFIQGNGGNNGAFGPDSTTADGSTIPPTPLRHGWQVLTGDNACALCSDTRNVLIEWRRDGTPSYREGIDPVTWTTDNNGDRFPDTAEQLGHGDFGPDRLVWIPHDPRDMRSDPARTPYMSLASFEDPVLSFLARYQAAENTAFVVEMQVPQRASCTGGQRVTCDGDWSWPTEWHPLVPEEATAGAPTISKVASTAQQGGGGGLGAPSEKRQQPSNPLAGVIGLWGQQSGGGHAHDDGWMRLHYAIDIDDDAVLAYCRMAAGIQDGGEASNPDFHPCLYAHASGSQAAGPSPDIETFVARPVRFRLSAASYGGDVGPSYWQIADLALTSHDLDIAGPRTIHFTMDDGDERRVPVRIRNDGSVDDVVRVTVEDPVGRSRRIGADGKVELSMARDFADPLDQASGDPEALSVDLAPGEVRTVWIRVTTGILQGAHPGTVIEVPLIVRVQSAIDPSAGTEALLDAAFRTRAWPDLEVTGLVFGEDGSKNPFQVPVGSPVPVMARVINSGQVPIGSEDAPVRVDLVERQLDPVDGSTLDGTERVVRSLLLGGSIRPFRDDPSDLLARFGEWTPPRVGVFQVEARVNPPGATSLPELDRGNNILARDVFVGPVRFADLHIGDVHVVEFRDGCGTEPVGHIIAGHAYCVAAHVENRGRQAALEPRVAFGVGSGLPFSSGSPSLEEIFSDGLFPGAVDAPVGVLVKSSPRVLGDRASGAWSFYAEVSSRSVFPNFENKTVGLELPVRQYALDVAKVPSEAVLSPGTEVEVRFQVTNEGDAPATPHVLLEGPPTYRLVSSDPPLLHPGDMTEVTVRIVASPDVRAIDGPPTLTLSTIEDDLLRLPVPILFVLDASAAPVAVALSAETRPGATLVSVLLDNADGPAGVDWRLIDTTGPVRADAWEASTAPFERRVEAIPVVVHPQAIPGGHTVHMVFTAGNGSVEHTLEVPWTVRVLPHAVLEATGPQGPVVAAAGAPVPVPFQVINHGNVPLQVRITHTVDGGSLVPPEAGFELRPGDDADMQVTVTSTLRRALGATNITWQAPNGTTGHTELEWELQVSEARVVLVSTDLSSLRPRAGEVNMVSVRLENPGSTPLDVEVVVAVDGDVHGRTVARLEPGRPQDVQVPFRAGRSGEPQEVVVLVRPLGSLLGPDEPGLYEVGDARSASLRPGDEGDERIPALGPLMLISVLAMALLRRKWT